MFIPPDRLKDQFKKPAEVSGKVRLQSAHLIIAQELAHEAFGDQQNVYVVYYPERRSLMLASVTDDLFKQLHKASQQMLKNRNARGDKTIALHETLIDHQVDTQDRNLEYQWQANLGVLTVNL